VGSVAIPAGDLLAWTIGPLWLAMAALRRKDL
jgi:hypothetical protein